MRKGDILLFLGEDENIKIYFDFLKHKINNKVTKSINLLSQSIIVINGYCIHIIKTLCPEYCRGFRPEISYINKSIDINNKLYKDSWEGIYIKTAMYSNRKIPVRFIDGFKDINIKELIDDNYAMENTINIKKCKEFDGGRV